MNNMQLKNKFIEWFDYLLLGALLFFIYPMAKITMQYIPYHTDVGFLRIKQQYIHIDVWRTAFFVHVYTSMLVLLAGFTQFNKYILKYRPKLHRLLGYVYVGNILCITGPASFIMSLYANGGTLSIIAFTLLATLWIFFTAKALQLAKQKKFKLHKIYMIRSFALTLSAITLRAWKFAITNSVELPPMDVYRMVAWLGWGVNLIVAEMYIRRYLVTKAY
jgi:uncharacterized membrane protein